MSNDDLDPDDIPNQTPPRRSRPHVNRPQESVSDSDQSLSDDYGNGSQLVSLMRLHPFMTLMIFVAKSRYPAKRSDRSRVEQFIDDHSGYYKACWYADFVLTVVLVVMLLATLGLGAAKTLFGTF